MSTQHPLIRDLALDERGLEFDLFVDVAGDPEVTSRLALETSRLTLDELKETYTRLLFTIISYYDPDYGQGPIRALRQAQRLVLPSVVHDLINKALRELSP